MAKCVVCKKLWDNSSDPIKFVGLYIGYSPKTEQEQSSQLLLLSYVNFMVNIEIST